MFVKLQSAIAFFTSSCMVCVASAPSNLGFVVTNGEVQVDGAVVRGNSTLFPGSSVRSGTATSDLIFSGGSNLLLQADSVVSVYPGYALLVKGSAIQHGTRGVMANGLSICSLSSHGAVVVGIKDGAQLDVTARDGAAEVRNSTGALLAHLEPGKGFSFSIQAQESPTTSAPPQVSSPVFGIGSQSQQITIHGILRKDHAGRYGHYLVTDTASKIVYELQGNGLDDLVGASVEAIGTIFDTAPAEGAAKVLSVSDVHQFVSSESPGATAEAAPGTDASGQPEPNPSAGVRVPAAPDSSPTAEAPSPTSDAATSAPPPLVVHSDTTKIIVIVAIAAGAAVGVALGLGGGKSSTVSPE